MKLNSDQQGIYSMQQQIGLVGSCHWCTEAI